MRAYVANDFETIKQWVHSREKVQILEETLSPVGAIIDDVACGFLQMTDNVTFSLEGFVTNPKANLFQRGRAIIQIAVALCQLAKMNGFRRLLIVTREKGISKILKKYGFSLEPVTMGIKYI